MTKERVRVWEILERPSLSNATTALVFAKKGINKKKEKSAIIWLLGGGSLWKSPHVAVCVRVCERVCASVWNQPTRACFYCWKEGKRGKKRSPADILYYSEFYDLITVNERNEDQRHKKGAGICRLQNIVMFWWCIFLVLKVKKLTFLAAANDPKVNIKGHLLCFFHCVFYRFLST